MPPSWAPPDINIMPGESCDNNLNVESETVHAVKIKGELILLGA